MSRGKSRPLELIEASHEILREIQPATVRAVCYRLFVAGLIDVVTGRTTVTSPVTPAVPPLEPA